MYTENVVSEKSSLKKLFQYGFIHPISSLRFLKENHRLAENNRNPFDISQCHISKDKSNFITYLTEEPVREEWFSTAEELFNSKINKINSFYGSYKTSTVSLDEASVIYHLVRLLKPQIAVETGVRDGMSSLMILSAMKDNRIGHLYSIDLPDVGMPKLYGKEPGWIVDDDLREKWTMIYGSSASKLPSLLKNLKNIDFFLHDSEHSLKNMLFEFSLALNYLNDGAALISDDVTSNCSLQKSIENRNESQSINLLRNKESDFGGFILRRSIKLFGEKSYL